MSQTLQDQLAVQRRDVLGAALLAEPALALDYMLFIARLVDSGAEAVILGCTEIMLLVRPEDSQVPIFDTTALHAAAAIDMALAG